MNVDKMEAKNKIFKKIHPPSYKKEHDCSVGSN